MKRLILFVIAISLLSACSASPAVDVTGAWALVAYGDKAEPISAIEQVDSFIKFADGQVTGNVGCNSFGGLYQLKGKTIIFEPIMSTEMYCERTMEQEAGVLAALRGSVTVELEGDLLTLTSEDGQVVILTPRDLDY